MKTHKINANLFKHFCFWQNTNKHAKTKIENNIWTTEKSKICLAKIKAKTNATAL